MQQYNIVQFYTDWKHKKHFRHYVLFAWQITFAYIFYLQS